MQTLIEISKERNKNLNSIELQKLKRKPIDAFEKLRFYADKGYETLPFEDKSHFLNSFGIFDDPQRPNSFTIRIRIPGGQLHISQLKVLAELAENFSKETLEIVKGMHMEIRAVRIEDIPTILEKLLDVELSTLQTGGDNLRNILTDPFDARASDAVGSSFEILKAMEKLFLNNWEWIGALPGKFNTAISNAFVNRCHAFNQDCAYVLAKKDGKYGYNLYLGGREDKSAEDVDIFVCGESEVLASFLALVRLYKEYGFRDDRDKNRLSDLIEATGISDIREAIETLAKRTFQRAGYLLMPWSSDEAKDGHVTLKDESIALRLVVPSGSLTPMVLEEIVEFCEKYASREIRLSANRNLYILGIQAESMEEVLEDKLFTLFKNRVTVTQAKK